MSVEMVNEHLYRLLLGRFQAYVWRDSHGVTLIDTGPADSGAQIAAALDELGLAPSDLDRIVLTHGHDDHVGAAAEVRDWGTPEVVAPRGDAAAVRGEAELPQPRTTGDDGELWAGVIARIPPAPPVAVDREVDDGDVVDFGGGAVVVAAPGHTPGTIALHLPEHRVLIAGDAAAEHMGRVHLAAFNVDPDLALTSLTRLATLPVEIAVFGHGEPVRRAAARRLADAVAAVR